MQTAKKIVIVGGGIGGAATALALHHAGFDVMVYERTPELPEVGAGVALWANATHVLKNLGVLQDTLSASQFIARYQFNSQSGEELMSLPVDHFEVPAICIHRADLHAILWRNLPRDRFVFGQAFERFEQVGNKVRIHFASGLTVESDALIGADGLNSRVRSQLLGDGKPIYRGFTAWRGLTDYIPSAHRHDCIREFLGYGRGFGFVMIGKKRMYWYVAAKATEGQPDAAIGRKKELQLMFQDWCEPIPELIAATDEANILRNDLYDRVPTQPWSQQNITLLGDAAHPTLPTLGQGACMALEDAIVVTKCLLASDTKAAFEQYESQRFARTKMIVEESLQAAKLGQWENRAAVALREIFMKLLPTPVLKNKVNALQAYRV
ncbi:FAD-dependent oxidoreductase [Hassallia byssoidea VB512170]|uniref:FAD-dependent oxidoreductase n=1 Tax=Hassallia byssoidea VB512170 TaxID=1304833 RepID=A0A846HEK9_9CYAN|nr:FAD-dependent oxidoreductase [Hassalia byssoidea]NEU75239.1 FAD-dependent oxidoreductase [Hassalia byssoidea VB512170]